MPGAGNNGATIKFNFDAHTSTVVAAQAMSGRSAMGGLQSFATPSPPLFNRATQHSSPTSSSVLSTLTSYLAPCTSAAATLASKYASGATSEENAERRLVCPSAAFGTKRLAMVNSPRGAGADPHLRLATSLLPLCADGVDGVDGAGGAANGGFSNALLGPSLAVFSFCSSALGALALLTVAGVLNASAPVNDRFQCALSAASCTATCILYWRFAYARKQPLMQGYTDPVNASLESQRYLGWVLNVALLTMIGVSLHGETGFDVLVGATSGALSMICAATGWSTLGEAVRRIAHRSRGGWLLVPLGGVLLAGSAVAAMALHSQLVVKDPDAYQLRYGDLRQALLRWVRNSCLSYPLFSILSATWNLAAICSRTRNGECDRCAEGIACVLGTILQSRRGGGGSTHYSPVALVDEMCLHQLEGKRVNLTWPSRATVQQHQILDTLGCLVDLLVVGGAAVGCALLAFSNVS